MKIWLDDIRPAPEGYIWCKSVNEAISKVTINTELADLDHDLGDYAEDGGDAIKFMDYLVENNIFIPLVFHTANPVGRANMERMYNRYWKGI